ncbi:alpha-L-fucosidase [Labilibacter marinus]|uniref:alpha-L-fucosidase n=1 Tax=Labilibacter marinus TaxID=1477105 RepID=UPI00094F9A4A|nr:alpha-L-fucosidase [Labilibacter marinus]
MKHVLFIYLVLLMTNGLLAQKKIYKENWESLSVHNESPEWFSDAKLGIYFHWGVISVPAFRTEWYPYFMYRDTKERKHHIQTYGELSKFNYHDFIPMFKAEKFDADEWAQLFKDAGAKFAGPCAQHHDGFAMWDSEVNPWNAADKGPQKDITGYLEKAIKGNDMKFITTFHHARNLQRHGGDTAKFATYHSHFAHVPGTATASTDPELAKLYGNMPADEFHEYWFAQIKEVIDQYSPDIVWFDVWLKLIPVEYRKKFAAYYLNAAKKTNQDVVIAYKQAAIPKTVGVLDIEQGGKKDLSETVWLTDVTLTHKSWSHVEGDSYYSPELLIRNFIDVWSKNGVVLLNIAPRADGVINKEQRDILIRIGQWMKKNSEAVYETRPFTTNGFGYAKAVDGTHGGQSIRVQYTPNDGRFMVSKDGKNLYLFLLGKPKPGTEIKIKKLGKHLYYPDEGLSKITHLGSNADVKWHFEDRHFVLTIPDAEMDDIANVFRMTLNK